MIEYELHQIHINGRQIKDIYISKREQLLIAFRYIYKFRTVERFVGFTLASELNAQALVECIFHKVSVLKLHLASAFDFPFSFIQLII